MTTKYKKVNSKNKLTFGKLGENFEAAISPISKFRSFEIGKPIRIIENETKMVPIISNNFLHHIIFLVFLFAFLNVHQLSI